MPSTWEFRRFPVPPSNGHPVFKLFLLFSLCYQLFQSLEHGKNVLGLKEVDHVKNTMGNNIYFRWVTGYANRETCEIPTCFGTKFPTTIKMKAAEK